MKVRYESFGGIIGLEKPAGTVYVDQVFMREIGYVDSPLWQTDSACLSAPVTAHLALTKRCPMGCKMCYSTSNTTDPETELSTDQVKSILDILAQMQVFTVAFGGGEPMARADLYELARHARRRGLTPTATTNGFFVNRRNASQCRVFDHIHVSLDGVDDVYRAVRGVDGFGHAANALKLLTRAGVSVGINCVVCRSNYDHLGELAQYAISCGVRDILFLRLKPAGRIPNGYESLCLTPEQRRSFYPLLKDLTLRYGLQTHVDCAMMPFIYWHNPSKELMRLFAVEGCVGANEIIAIQTDGEMRACSFAASKAGDVNHLPLHWRTSSSFVKFREWILNAPEPCRSCKHLDLCRGGCHAIAESITGNFYAPDPECPYVTA